MAIARAAARPAAVCFAFYLRCEYDFNRLSESFNVHGRYDIRLPTRPFNGFVYVDYGWRGDAQWNLDQDPLTLEDAYGQLGSSIGIQEPRGRYTLRCLDKQETNGPP